MCIRDRDSTEGTAILENILGTPGVTATNANTHLGSYGSLIEDVPGINYYFDSKFEINESAAQS